MERKHGANCEHGHYRYIRYDRNGSGWVCGKRDYEFTCTSGPCWEKRIGWPWYRYDHELTKEVTDVISFISNDTMKTILAVLDLSEAQNQACDKLLGAGISRLLDIVQEVMKDALHGRGQMLDKEIEEGSVF